MKKRRIIAVVLCMIAAAFALTGCGESAPDGDADAASETQTEETSADPVLLYMATRASGS